MYGGNETTLGVEVRSWENKINIKFNYGKRPPHLASWRVTGWVTKKLGISQTRALCYNVWRKNTNLDRLENECHMIVYVNRIAMKQSDVIMSG